VCNCVLQIIASILATRLKTILPKIINIDQKGFAKGRNINKANRLIQDIIDYIDMKTVQGITIFLDQQKAFDRIERGWVQACHKKIIVGQILCMD
jgi:hypothetical protein